MSGPVLLWEHVGAGLVEPLDEHLADFDLADFLPRLIEVNRWTGRAGDPLGAGPLLELPVNCESYNLAFVPDILGERGLDVPQTWEDYFAVARESSRGRWDAPRLRAARPRRVAHDVHRVRDAAVELRRARLRPRRTRGVRRPRRGRRDRDLHRGAARRRPRGLDAISAGTSSRSTSGGAATRCWSTPTTTSPSSRTSSHSDLVGRIGYAPPPAGPTGERRPNLWTWSLAMTAASRDKRAARDFIAWAASKSFLLRSAGEGNMNPTRTSTWDDPAFQALTAPWGDFATVSRQLVDEHATVLVTPTPHYREIALRWTEALREAYLGRDVGEALRAAAADAESGNSPHRTQRNASAGSSCRSSRSRARPRRQDVGRKSRTTWEDSDDEVRSRATGRDRRGDRRARAVSTGQAPLRHHVLRCQRLDGP